MTNTDRTTVIESKSVTFFRLFCEGRFRVPWHQRRYDWKPDHVLELLRDIDEAFGAGSQCYFLGMVIFVESARRQWHINDGQQRMVTLSLICACLRRLFTDHNDSLREYRALRILFDVDESSTEVLENIDHQTPRITPPSDDKICYNQMIRGHSIGTNGKLTLAWRQIDSFVLGMGVEKARRFFDFLTQKLELACLYIPESVDPNSVYETINCRGKRLDDLDLIRNHLYSYFNSDEDEQRRHTVHGNLEKIYDQLRDNARFTDYARCYFQSRHGFLRKSTFYRETRNHIRSEADHHERAGKTRSDYVFSLIEDFSRREQIELFRTIAAPNRSDRFIEDFTRLSGQTAAKRNASTFLKELQTYKVTQPLLFALLMRYVKQTEEAGRRNLAKWIHVRLKHVTSFVMRTAFVAPKFEPSHFESEFSNLAQRVTLADNVYDVDVDGCLKNCDGHGVIDDKKFKTRMCEIEMRDVKKIRRFLFGVNYHTQTDSDLVSESRCTIEHVLPKAERHWANWYGFENVNPEEWIHRIGNLTLLGRQDNKPGDADNGDFATKKNICSRSAIKITREIGDCDGWTPDEIRKRQRRFAAHAARVWSFEQSMK